jgi:RNA polymerase sigma factor (sigma-70 family)
MDDSNDAWVNELLNDRLWVFRKAGSRADDVMNEAIAKMLASKSHLKRDGKQLLAVFRKTVNNILCDQYRALRRCQKFIRTVQESPACFGDRKWCEASELGGRGSTLRQFSEPEYIVVKREMKQDDRKNAEKAMRRMSPGERSFVESLMAYKSYDEIASRQRVSRDAVVRMANRILHKLPAEHD